MSLNLQEENLSAVGRVFVNTDTNYQNDEYERTSEVKEEQRTKILNFILSNHADSTPFLLSLAGKYWSLENRLVTINKDTHITSIEKSPLIFHKAKSMMPTAFHPNKIVDKTRFITDTKIKLDMFSNRNSNYFLGELSALTERVFHNQLCGDSGTFRHGMTNRTCVWYDFTSSLNNVIYNAIRNIKNIRNKGRDTVVCITLLYGRDLIFKGSSIESRLDIIQEALPELKIHEYWKYKGFNNSTMLNVCGVIPAEVKA